MTTSVESYRNDLLLALRLRDVPGPRIAEVLAEVESHVGDTAEDPRETFGEPKEYAEQVAAAIGLAGRGGVRGWLIALEGPAGVIGLLSLAGGLLLPTGCSTSARAPTARRVCPPPCRWSWARCSGSAWAWRSARSSPARPTGCSTRGPAQTWRRPCRAGRAP